MDLSKLLEKMDLSKLLDLIDDHMRNSTHPLIIGISGPPGSGKSTIANHLRTMITSHHPAIVVPMDGYHLYKKDLDSEGFKRRGAHWTFDSRKFVEDIRSLKTNYIGSFPSFDHHIGDPIENDITVSSSHRIIIIEGNYLYLSNPPWNELLNLFDIKVFIKCDINTIRERVIARHQSTGLTLEESTERVDTNDILNAIEINETIDKADLIIENQ